MRPSSFYHGKEGPGGGGSACGSSSSSSVSSSSSSSSSSSLFSSSSSSSFATTSSSGVGGAAEGEATDAVGAALKKQNKEDPAAAVARAAAGAAAGVGDVGGQHACRECGTAFASRNRLFKHLKLCASGDGGVTAATGAGAGGAEGGVGGVAGGSGTHEDKGQECTIVPEGAASAGGACTPIAAAGGREDTGPELCMGACWGFHRDPDDAHASSYLPATCTAPPATAGGEAGGKAGGEAGSEEVGSECVDVGQVGGTVTE